MPRTSSDKSQPSALDIVRSYSVLPLSVASRIASGVVDSRAYTEMQIMYLNEGSFFSVFVIDRHAVAPISYTRMRPFNASHYPAITLQAIQGSAVLRCWQCRVTGAMCQILEGDTKCITCCDRRVRCNANNYLQIHHAADIKAALLPALVQHCHNWHARLRGEWPPRTYDILSSHGLRDVIPPPFVDTKLLGEMVDYEFPCEGQQALRAPWSPGMPNIVMDSTQLLVPAGPSDNQSTLRPFNELMGASATNGGSLPRSNLSPLQPGELLFEGDLLMVVTESDYDTEGDHDALRNESDYDTEGDHDVLQNESGHDTEGEHDVLQNGGN
ncbi:hypothetical protein IE81DRAFT_364387 [Ceraceosorus guamensis]|uniref:Uncharacterized protein n=1 Tax=Ceraceosorus guamensis TaxID=1522189 RepID=A0A316W598_9BASI|nr:hypothetical protein IE81DRAFT_364387 [Ceraceosorus guamensis]PWN44999.1 hypothetical protein IE81DRAFT_364387 [Ceraceosorus guamensis]